MTRCSRSGAGIRPRDAALLARPAAQDEVESSSEPSSTSGGASLIIEAPSDVDLNSPAAHVGLGAVTPALLEVCRFLRIAQDAKDGLYCASQVSPQSFATPAERAEQCRRRGNHFYKRKQFSSAAALYSEGLVHTPDEASLWCNRAACHAKLGESLLCFEDALEATRLDPKLMRGWLLLAKALWRDGAPVMAKQVLAEAWAFLPGCPELLELNSNIDKAVHAQCSQVGLAQQELAGEAVQPSAAQMPAAAEKLSLKVHSRSVSPVTSVVSTVTGSSAPGSLRSTPSSSGCVSAPRCFGRPPKLPIPPLEQAPRHTDSASSSLSDLTRRANGVDDAHISA